MLAYAGLTRGAHQARRFDQRRTGFFMNESLENTPYHTL